MTGKSGLPHFLAGRAKGTGVWLEQGRRRGSAGLLGRAALRGAGLGLPAGERLSSAGWRGPCGCGRACSSSSSSSSEAVYTQAPPESRGPRSSSEGATAWGQSSPGCLSRGGSGRESGKSRCLQRALSSLQADRTRKGVLCVCLLCCVCF